MKTIIALAALTMVQVASNAAEMVWEAEVDWEAKGCVTPAKDQGKCGASWAFAATAGLESGYCAHTSKNGKGTLYELSAQDIVSCSRADQSCDESKGSSSYAYDWVGRLNGGSICTEKSYPYESDEGTAPSCKRFYWNPPFHCEKPELGAYFHEGGKLDRAQIEATVLKQPVVGRLNAKWNAFTNYTGGLLRGNESACSSAEQNHDVLIVGFGTCDGVPCWKIKNSRGSKWGNNGYAYLERGYNTDGVCGLEKYGYYPVFTTASDPRLNTRTAIPTRGLMYLGDQINSPSSGVWGTDECSNRCIGDATCVGYSYDSTVGYCKLMSSINGNYTSASGFYAKKITKAQSYSTCEPITANVDFPGNDLKTTVAATADDCCDHCDAVFKCSAFTWSSYNGGMCYLKTQATAKPVAASNGSVLLKSAVKYKCQPLQKDTDINAADIGSAPSSTPANCCGICRATDECTGFSWTDYNGGTCWLKTVSPFSPGPFTKAGVISATVS